MKKIFRELALALLDDEHGISNNAYDYLFGILMDTGNGDICATVKGTNGRVYLPEDHGLT